MGKKRTKLVVALGALCAALAIGVPVVAASSSSEQPAAAGGASEIQRASTSSGGEGDIVAAAQPRVDWEPASAP